MKPNKTQENPVKPSKTKNNQVKPSEAEKKKQLRANKNLSTPVKPLFTT